MSPSEEQLRRALSEGEGTGPDVDTVLVRAAAFRRERRTKVLAAAAAVAVVAGVGIGVGFAASRPGGRHAIASDKEASGNANGAGGGAPERSLAASGGEVVPGANNGPFSSSSLCPAELPSIRRTADSNKPLFNGAVSSVTVCGYLGTGAVIRSNAVPVSQTFAGASAADIASSVERPPTTQGGIGCGAIPASAPHALLVLATYTSGTQAAPVAIGLGCDTSLTNGVTTRHGWDTPSELSALLAALQTAASTQVQPDGSSIAPQPTTT